MQAQANNYDNVQVYTGQPSNTEGFNMPAPSAGQGHALASVDEFRAIAEVQASMAIAKRFPRDEFTAYNRIMTACKRKSLADNAAYAYPRGGTTVTGPSIRLAEVLANAWGNIDYGYREVGSGADYTDVEAYAFDKESNTRSCRTFRVKHIRSTKLGNKSLSDPRDVYELVANQASRRIRACILQIIPGDVTEQALLECEKTIKQAGGGVPIQDRARNMAAMFLEYGVTVDMIEQRLGHKLDAIIEQELIQLGKIYNSIKDGAAKREDFFEVAASLPKSIPAKEEQPKPATKTKAEPKEVVLGEPSQQEQSKPSAPVQSAQPEKRLATGEQRADELQQLEGKLEQLGKIGADAVTAANEWLKSKNMKPVKSLSDMAGFAVSRMLDSLEEDPCAETVPDTAGKITCPNTNKLVDELDCPACPNRPGCPAWED